MRDIILWSVILLCFLPPIQRSELGIAKYWSQLLFTGSRALECKSGAACSVLRNVVKEQQQIYLFIFKSCLVWGRSVEAVPGSTSTADGSGLCYPLACEGQWAAVFWVHLGTLNS